MAIITAAEYKTWKRISASTWDSQIAAMITAAQGGSERYCGQKFDYDAAAEEIVSGDASEYLFLTRTPVESITSVVYTDESGGTDTVASTEYRVDPYTGVLYRLSGADWGWSPNVPKWVQGFRNYTVTYAGGYGTTGSGDGVEEMPAALKMTQYQIIDILLSESPGGSPGPGLQFQSENLADYAYARIATDERFKTIRAILETWRRGRP